MNRFTRYTATALTALACAGTGVLRADSLARPDGSKRGAAGPTVTTYATGLTNPRGLAFGPDGRLYVAEAGVGGGQVPADIDPACPVNVNIYSPYTAGYSGRVTRVLANGTTETVADHLPSMTDAYGGSYGPTDVAFVGDTLYVLIEMGGCSHALPEHLPAILRVLPDGSTTNVANLNAWLAANPPNFLKDTNPATTDLEPGGVFHSMIAQGRYLYVVETNRGFLLRVDPQSGIDRASCTTCRSTRQEHNPIVMARRGNEFLVGTFGEDGGPAELAVFDKYFSGYSLPFESLQPDRRPGVAAATSSSASRSSRSTIRGRPTAPTSSTFDRQDRRAHGGADRLRQLPERTRDRPRRCAVHVEPGDFVRAGRR